MSNIGKPNARMWRVVSGIVFLIQRMYQCIKEINKESGLQDSVVAGDIIFLK